MKKRKKEIKERERGWYETSERMYYVQRDF